jgi:hypothetical protein
MAQQHRQQAADAPTAHSPVYSMLLVHLPVLLLLLPRSSVLLWSWVWLMELLGRGIDPAFKSSPL